MEFNIYAVRNVAAMVRCLNESHGTACEGSKARALTNVSNGCSVKIGDGGLNSGISSAEMAAKGAER